MEVTGTVVKILQKQTGTNKTGGTWEKQDFVLETEGQYPKKICIGVMGDKLMPILANFTVGTKVTASLNIESREYNERWYTEVRAWKLSNIVTAQPVVAEDESNNDLPF